VEGSHRHQRASRALAKPSADPAKKRRDHPFKLAHRVCDEYDRLCFEDLNRQAMKALWGRKVSDLGLASFLSLLEWVGFKRGKPVIKIDRCLPTTKTGSGCGQKHDRCLRDRVLAGDCGLTLSRDHNAALKIKPSGASLCYRSDRKPQVRLRRRVEGRSPRLKAGGVCHNASAVSARWSANHSGRLLVVALSQPQNHD
jgi:putative transposase